MVLVWIYITALSMLNASPVTIKLNQDAQIFTGSKYGIYHGGCSDKNVNCARAGAEVTCNKRVRVNLPIKEGIQDQRALDVCQSSLGNITIGYYAGNEYVQGLPQDCPTGAIDCNIVVDASCPKENPNCTSLVGRNFRAEMPISCTDTDKPKLGCKNMRIKIDKSTQFFQGMYGVDSEECSEDLDEKGPNCLPPGEIVTCLNVTHVKVPSLKSSVSLEICDMGNGKYLTIGNIVGNIYKSGLPYCDNNNPDCSFILTKDGRLGKYPFPKPEQFKPKQAESPQPTSSSEACTDCSLSEPSPSLPGPVDSARSAADQILRSSGDTLKCKEKTYTRPTDKTDAYFFDIARKAGKGCYYHNYITYKPDVNRAIDAFKIDKSMFLCLLHKESAWNPKTISNSGVVGLGQVTQPTLIETIKDTSSKFSEGWNKYFERHSTISQIKSDFEKNKISRYLTKLDAEKISKGMCDIRCDPVLSIGVSALYVKHIIQNYTNKKISSQDNGSSALIVPNQKPMTDINKDYLVFVAGLYNLGPGHAGGIISQTDLYKPSIMKEKLIKLDTRGCVNKIKENKLDCLTEIESHMTSIDQCMVDLGKL